MPRIYKCLRGHVLPPDLIKFCERAQADGITLPDGRADIGRAMNLLVNGYARGLLPLAPLRVLMPEINGDGN